MKLSFLFQHGFWLSFTNIQYTVLLKLTFLYASTFLKVLTIGTKCLCSFDPNLWGPVNTGTYNPLLFLTLDKKGRINQGPRVQGPTHTGTHETETHHHSTMISAEYANSNYSPTTVFNDNDTMYVYICFCVNNDLLDPKSTVLDV